MKPRDPAAMLARLQSVTAAFSRALSPPEVARVAVTHGLAALEASSAALALVTADGKHLELVDHEGMDPNAASRFRSVPMTMSSASVDAVRTKAPIFIETRELYEADYPSVAPLTPFTDGAKASLPLEVDGRVLGALGFAYDKWRAIDERERAFMCALAAVTAQALDRARLYADSEGALREAEAANKLKDEFLATVSHELRTPLNAILGWASMLRGPPLEGAASAKGLDVIERNARSLARLVDDVLDVSRIIRGKLRVDQRSMDIGQVVRAAIDATAPAVAAKQLVFETVIAADVGNVDGDADRLQQVVWNLVSNAVKFTPRGGRVRVEVTRADDVIRIIVFDTGIGIDPAFLPHVFDRFRQYDSSTTRPHGGLGLGLAIARHLVELHGGTLSVASPGNGKGAVFTVELTASRAAASDAFVEAENGTAPPPSTDALAGLRVLVADDAGDSRDLIKRVLESAGAVVVTVGCATDALEAIEQTGPDVMVADIGMPGDDGYTLMRWVRARDPAAGGLLPAVALTGYASSEDRDIALRAGYEEHLSKPASPAELVRVVARLAKRPAQDA
jgi:signal transduction histidine kinase/ActR/RegA family two-component response regulator